MVYGAMGGSRNPRANAFQQTFTGSATTPDLLFQDPFSGNVPGGGLPNVGGFQDPIPQWYVPNWGISVEHQLTPNTMFEIGYQGSHSVHEIQIVEVNDAVPGTAPRQSRRPFPALQSYQLLVGNGDQRYDALELKFEKRLGPDGLTTLLVYTWVEKPGHDRRTPQCGRRPRQHLKTMLRSPRTAGVARRTSREGWPG